MITQNNSINKFTSIIVVLMMVFSLISISTIKAWENGISYISRKYYALIKKQLQPD